MRRQRKIAGVRNLNKKFRINEVLVGRLADKIAGILKRAPSEIEIVFLSDRAIRSVNKRFKGRDRATDVLSFDLDGTVEILISSDTALKNSRVFGVSCGEELIRYVVHGMLHVSGYDDRTVSQKRRMFRKEGDILKILCAKTELSKVLTRP